MESNVWLKTIARVLREIKNQSRILKLVDCSVGTLLNCLGGPQQLTIDSELRHDEPGDLQFPVGSQPSRAGMLLIMAAFEKSFLFEESQPTSLPISSQEWAVVRSYLENLKNKMRRGPRSTKREATAHSCPANLSSISIPALKQAIHESDILSVQRELSRAGAYMVGRTASVTEALCRPSQEQGNANKSRTHVLLNLESDRAQLVSRCVVGILRCFGGKQRLLIEAARARNTPKEIIHDPEVKEIVERVVTRVHRLASEESDATSNS